MVAGWREGGGSRAKRRRPYPPRGSGRKAVGGERVRERKTRGEEGKRSLKLSPRRENLYVSFVLFS